MHKAFGKIKENQKIERVLIWGIPPLGCKEEIVYTQ